jgi:hypothetical protein
MVALSGTYVLDLPAAMRMSELYQTLISSSELCETRTRVQALTRSGRRSAPTSVTGSTTRATSTRRQARCPRASGSGDGNLAPLDTTTANVFDNAYYANLLVQSGLLHSDQVLFNGGATDSLVRTYATAPARFNRDFAAAMVRMGSISPLTGSQGQIRLACSRVN